jgi:hypothetical protein
MHLKMSLPPVLKAGSSGNNKKIFERKNYDRIGIGNTGGSSMLINTF